MNSFEELLKEIHFQIANVKDEKRLPYYLFVSKVNHQLIKNGFGNEKDNGFYKHELFDNMEVVVLSDVPNEYVEVKGIIDRNAKY